MKTSSGEKAVAKTGRRSRAGILLAASFPLLIGAIVAMVLMLVAPPRAPGLKASLLRNACFFFLFAASNALVMYTVAGNHVRYQSRCSWMVAMQLFFLAAAAIGHFPREK